jgi:acylphosphatase
MATVATRLIITGRVQGVGFRAWTQREARRRALRGWVRNRRDGSVEALIIGAPDAVDALVEICRRGPTLARVDQVTPSPAEDDGSPDFSERATV